MSEPRILSGRYEVHRLLGRGGMAEVHEGLDTRLGRRVAIKLLRSDLARDPSFHARLKREAQAAAGLNHPGIVAVYDSGEEVFSESGGSTVQVPFIVMEYVEGQTLREVISTHGSLTIREALDVTAGVLGPLEYSHRNGIVHRDIKPANVMLTPEGDIKVMDFGIARALEDTGSLTQTQSVVGTAQYLSPEQARGEIVDARSDLYSTACLLYELVAGRPPFQGDSQLAVAYQHVGERPKAPSEFNPEVPPALDRLLMHALEKDRDIRYQDAFTFREDVLAVRDGRPTSLDAGDEDATQVFSPPAAIAAGHGTPQPAYATELPTQAMHTAPSTNAVATVPDSDDDADEERDRKRKAWLWVGAALVAVVLTGLGLWLYNATKEKEPVTFALADLRDRSADDAESYLISQNLVPDRESIADDEVKEGNVVKTDPPAGSQVAHGDTITIYVSTGPDVVTVPDVAGETESLARQRINDADLKAGNNIDENSPDVEAGTVIETRPKAGTEVDKDSNVDLVLSTGRIDVPDVLGKTEQEACDALKGDDYQLECDVKEEETADHEEGKVFKQSADAGEEVEQHATITITIAKAPPEPTQTPTPSPPPTDDDDDGGGLEWPWPDTDLPDGYDLGGLVDKAQRTVRERFGI
ncbi:Stk1 family PASTA domain-containing Ser/Thr kinase [Brevibacterium otitidis]|uniref:non-specific serine/threonine protein kinase n=1 Tax=Brevibacterium otitidis TaxID=53364 RepID=A0ABV5X2A2_9MICO|nr:Stk1 family PASTA domain-containing Ser/Thr kinase [Brevibacterium otitidis]